MFSATDRDRESTEDSFAEELSRLKQSGASILVVGSVRPEQQASVSRRLLGQASARSRQRVLVSTCNRNGGLFDFEGAASGTRRRVRYESRTRNATAQESAGGGDAGPSIENDERQTVAETLGDLGIAISAAIDGIETDAGDLGPGELRVGVDSLLPLLEDYSTEHVFKFLHLTNARVKAVGGMVHYQCPVDRDADVISILTPLFDVVVELHDRNGHRQERWTLPSGDSSGWIATPET